MSAPHHSIEHAEHISHSGHDHHGDDHGDDHGHGDGTTQPKKPKVTNKLMGLTMALIGVLIAFCSASAGSERNALDRSMIEQADANSNKISASIKFRIIMVELERIKQQQHDNPALVTPPDKPSTMLRRTMGLYLDYHASGR